MVQRRALIYGRADFRVVLPASQIVVVSGENCSEVGIMIPKQKGIDPSGRYVMIRAPDTLLLRNIHKFLDSEYFTRDKVLFLIGW